MAALYASGLTLKQVGERYGLCAERVRQLLRSAPAPDPVGVAWGMTPATFARIRRAAGLTQSQLAERLRISDKRTIRRWETGERPISGPVTILMEQLAEEPEAPVIECPHCHGAYARPD